MTRRLLLFASMAVMAVLLMLPGLAAATPMVYDVQAGGSITLSMTLGSSASAAVASPTPVSLGSGRVTFDSVTGKMTDLQLSVPGGGQLIARGAFFKPTQPIGTSPNGNSVQLVFANGLGSAVIAFTAVPVTTPGPTAGNPVPEPRAALLFATGVGVVGLVGSRRRED